MELLTVNQSVERKVSPFIEANTTQVSLEEIEKDHIIPVFVRDNEPIISHQDFVSVMQEEASVNFNGEQMNEPSIRVSHPIMGRIPDAKLKAAKDLEEFEKTRYYERMAFIMEFPNITEEIGGQSISLVVGGVRNVADTNLYNLKGANEYFQIFIGFKVKVCTNLCVWTDGRLIQISVTSIDSLRAEITAMLQAFRLKEQLTILESFGNLGLSEHQFAHLLGKCRMYCQMPRDMKRKRQKGDLFELNLNDTLLNQVASGYYKDEHFKSGDRHITLWNLYNLFTGAVKNSYIDKFVLRNANCFDFVHHLKVSLDHKDKSWFLT